MGIVKEVNINITGQVSDDYTDNDYRTLLAKLEVICAEYDLILKE